VITPETMIPVNLELVNDLWLPNIFIYNLKTFKVSVPSMLSQESFLLLKFFWEPWSNHQNQAFNIMSLPLGVNLTPRGG
jgi:hypothetical protein